MASQSAAILKTKDAILAALKQPTLRATGSYVWRRDDGHILYCIVGQVLHDHGMTDEQLIGQVRTGDAKLEYNREKLARRYGLCRHVTALGLDVNTLIKAQDIFDSQPIEYLKKFAGGK